ncbi:MAG: nuclear transport factor 2 family protein [Bacteroidota bacterium]
MKNTLFVLLVLLFSAASSGAQDSDYAQIERTLHYYLDGGTNNDFETLRKAFDESAVMRAGGEKPMEVNALEFFESRMKPGPKSNRQTRIAYINVMGTAANAQVVIDYEGFSFIDYMNLLKLDGEWKIVSKIFHRRVHPKPEQ